MAERRGGAGRPKGDGIDDDAELAAMADMLLASPGLRPTTAYKRIVRRPGDAAIRRIQAKWRERREALMAAARVRRDRAREPAPVRSRGSGLPTARGATEEAARRIDELVGGLGFGSGIASELAALSALRDAVDPPALRRMRELMENPLARAMRSLEGGFGTRTMREALGVWDSPTMLAARGIEGTAFARAARGIEDNSLSRAMRAQEKAMRDLLG